MTKKEIIRKIELQQEYLQGALDALEILDGDVKEKSNNERQVKEEIEKDLELAQAFLNGGVEMFRTLEEEGFFDKVDKPVKTFNDYTWEEIKELVDSGNHNFKVGDIKTINFRNEEYEIVIIGINHDGDNTITCQFRDIVFHKEMNNEKTNEDGFVNSDLFNYLNGEFIEELDKVVPVLQYSKLFLPSEFEVFGKNKYSDKEMDDEQYEYYKDKRNRVKFDKEIDYSRWHWLRSDYSGNSRTFAIVGNAGNVNLNLANYAIGVSPCFII